MLNRIKHFIQNLINHKNLPISTYVLLQLALQLGDVSLPLLLRIVHLSVQRLAGGGDEGRTEFVLLAGRLFNLAELGGEACELVRLDRQPALLGGFQLVLDRGLLRRTRLRRRGRAFKPRRLRQDHLVAQATLGFLLASDLSRCKFSFGPYLIQLF